MGTDIHMIGERKDYNDKWVQFEIPDYFQNRNYRFFACLGNVRNGHGFAGIETHEAIEPMTDSRGVPDDSNYDIELEYLGDHSFSHATLSEIKNYKWPKGKYIIGVLDEGHYKETIAKNINPSMWSGDVSGGMILNLSEQEYLSGNYDKNTDKQIYIKCRWIEDEFISQGFIDKFIMFLELWRDEFSKTPDETVRIIFGFDS